MLLDVVGCWMLLDVVGCCWMLLDVVGCCWMLLDVVGCRWMSLDVVGCCWMPLDVGLALNVLYLERKRLSISSPWLSGAWGEDMVQFGATWCYSMSFAVLGHP